MAGIERTRTLVPPSFGISFFRARMGRYVLVTKFIPDLRQKPLRSAFLNGRKRDPVNARCPVIAFRHLVGFPKRFHLADMDVQPPETPSWFRLRLDI